MWPFNKKESNNRHVVNDDDRAASLETRRAQSNARANEIRIAQEKADLKWQIEREQMMAQLDEIKAMRDDNEDDDQGIGPLLVQLLSNSSTPTADGQEVHGTQANPSAVRRLTDEEIMNIIDGFDKNHVKMASKLPDSFLNVQLRNKVPGYDDDTYSRAVQIIKDRR